jgi:hypothetical protein
LQESIKLWCPAAPSRTNAIVGLVDCIDNRCGTAATADERGGAGRGGRRRACFSGRPLLRERYQVVVHVDADTLASDDEAGCALDVRHWARGGEATLDDLLLLCRRPHPLVHEGGYSIDDALLSETVPPAVVK